MIPRNVLHDLGPGRSTGKGFRSITSEHPWPVSPCFHRPIFYVLKCYQSSNPEQTIKNPPAPPFLPRAGSKGGWEGFSFPMKTLNEMVNRLECLVQLLKVRSPGLRKIRTSSSCSSNIESNLFNQIVGLEALGEIFSHPQDQGYLVLASPSQEDDSRTHFHLQLVHKISHPLWIFPIHLGREDPHPFHLPDGSQKVQDLLMR